jgi:hypothetical protein
MGNEAMNKKPLTPAAGSYIESDTHDLKFIFDKIRALNLIQEKVQTYLDPVLVKYCQVANLAENRLVLLVANGSVATQIRFMTNDLLKKFSQDSSLQHIRQIECKVRPAGTKVSEDKKGYQVEPLSVETAAIVRELAESIEDTRLREIMLRISEHTN